MFSVAILSCRIGLAHSWSADDYRKLSCLELAEEGRAISRRGFALAGLKAGRGGSNGSETEPAIVIVWPVKFAVSDKQQLENLALAIRQMDAIEQASIASQCSIRFQRPPVS